MICLKTCVRHGDRAGRGRVIGQRPHLDAAEPRERAVVVALQREGAVVQEALLLPAGRDHGRSRLGVVHHQHSVEPHLHVLAAHGHVDLEPLVVGYELLVDIAQAVQRPGLLAFAVGALAGGRVVDLDLEALLREVALLVARVEVHARIALVLRQHLHFQLEIAEVGAMHGAVVKQMGARALGGKLPVHHLPGAFVFAGAPAFQAVSVEEFDPPVIGGGEPERGHGTDERPACELVFGHQPSILPRLPGA